MSDGEWRCRNRACAAAHGSILGRLTGDGDGLVLDPAVRRFRVYLDARKVDIVCPRCETVRTFRGTAVYSERGTL
jgi:hypothetical protein